MASIKGSQRFTRAWIIATVLAGTLALSAGSCRKRQLFMSHTRPSPMNIVGNPMVAHASSWTTAGSGATATAMYTLVLATFYDFDNGNPLITGRPWTMRLTTKSGAVFDVSAVGSTLTVQPAPPASIQISANTLSFCPSQSTKNCNETLDHAVVSGTTYKCSKNDCEIDIGIPETP